MVRVAALTLVLAGCVRQRCEEPLGDLCTDCPTFSEVRADVLTDDYADWGVQIYGCNDDVFPSYSVVTLIRPDEAVRIDFFDQVGELVGRVTWNDSPRSCNTWTLGSEVHYGVSPECEPRCVYDLVCPFDGCLEELEQLPACPEDTG